MLYQLFDLQRDPAVHTTSYGSSTSVGYDLGRSYVDLISPPPDLEALPWRSPTVWDGTMTIGLAVALEGAPRQLPLYKSVEYWIEQSRVGPLVGGLARQRLSAPKPVVLERLFYQTRDGLVPYCWRYIDQYLVNSTLVHCANLELVHGQLQGLQGVLSVQDPRQIYLDTLAERRTMCFEERLQEVQMLVSETNHGRRFSRHAFLAENITDTLQKMASGLSWSMDTVRPPKTPGMAYGEFVAPVRQINDPITNATPQGAVSQTQLMRYAVAAPFDVSPPAPLEIRHPEVTQLQDRTCQILAQALDAVRLTDYAITLQMINGSPVNHRWDHVVNRYVAIFDNPHARNLTLDQTTLYNVAKLAFRCIAQRLDFSDHTTALLDAAEITISKTFGEEALVSLSCQGRVLCAYHIDFALQAFCSMGLAADSPLFQVETGVSRF